MKQLVTSFRMPALPAPIGSALRRGFAPLQLLPFVRRPMQDLMSRLVPFRANKATMPSGPAQIAPAEDPARVAAELESLPGDQTLVEAGPLAVFAARAVQIPRALREIGRLREIAFRNAGEGTGLALDLDRFDAHYTHLCLWNREAREIVGAYRLVETEPIVRRFGTAGLYTHTLFDYGIDLVEEMGPSIELGRSFIRVEYQRDIAPLFLLWKGIGRFVVNHPYCKRLFGPVSISNSYGPASRSLMIGFLRAHYYDAELAGRVRARTPIQAVGDQAHQSTTAINGVEELSAALTGLEGEKKAMPILLKQYLKLGGRLIGFNLDRDFSDVIDGLIVVDLTQTDPRILSRYLGEDGARQFLDYHLGTLDAACA